MKKLIQDIRNQPLHIRKRFMWTMVVIVFAIVGYIGFSSIGENFATLVNPDRAEEKALALETEEGDSPFQLFADIYGSIADGVTGLFDDDEVKEVEVLKTENRNPYINPQNFPIE
ncbi:MAG: hypothetical protein ABH833_04475 [Parcubacteria group bacterium]